MTDGEKIASFYDREAAALCQTYEGLDPAVLYAGAACLLPKKPAAVLDAAAGSGRDAAWLAGMGHRVVAVEPSAGMRAMAAALHAGLGVEWLDDSLPDLSRTMRPEGGFSFVLAAAVWMHLDPSVRPRAWLRLAELTAPGGTALVTLRHGPGDDERPMKPVSSETEAALAREAGFSKAWILPSGGDLLGRTAVTWSQLALVR